MVSKSLFVGWLFRTWNTFDHVNDGINYCLTVHPSPQKVFDATCHCILWSWNFKKLENSNCGVTFYILLTYYRPQFIPRNFKRYFLAFTNTNKIRLNAGKGLLWIKEVDGETEKFYGKLNVFKKTSVLYSFSYHFKT